MNENRSKEWKRADAEFARIQSTALPKIVQKGAASLLDEKSAQLKATRLARDYAENNLRENLPQRIDNINHFGAEY